MWLEIGKTVVEIFSKAFEADRKRRDRLSVLFNDISILLEQTATSLENDIYPHGSCAAMAKLTNELGYSLEGKIPNDQLVELQCMLRDASLIEREFMRRKDPKVIPEIFEAAGYFKALSIIYKV